MSSTPASSPTPAADSPRAARPEDQKLPLGPTLGYGLQHILSMFGGVIAVPIIIGGAAGVSPAKITLLIASALFISGIATLLQTLGVWRFGAQLPLVQGMSFASVSTLLTVVAGKGEHGLSVGFGAILVASLIALALVPLFSLVVKFFPPVVTGSIITVIGLSLLPVAAGWITGQAQVGGKANPDYAAPKNIALALVTLLIILVLTRFQRTSRSAIILGLLLGTIIAFVTGQASLDLSHTDIVAVPTPFAFGAPHVEVAATISMLVVMLVIMVETTADIIAVGEVIGADVDHRRVADGLRADMLSSVVAPVFNTFPPTAFAQNVGLVAMSGIKSRFVVAAGGGILALLGLSPVLAAVVGAIPQPVLGGAGIALFGTVAASGIKTLGTVKYDGTANLMIVAIAVGFGLLPNVSPDFWSEFPDWLSTITGSGISVAAIVAVVLNLAFNIRPRQGLEAAHNAAAEALPHHHEHHHDEEKELV